SPQTYGRVRKLAKRAGREPADSVGSKPTSATLRRSPDAGSKDRRSIPLPIVACRFLASVRESWSRRPAAGHLSYTQARDGSSPSGITESVGLLVQRDDTGIARR